jgi:hypothetical protein
MWKNCVDELSDILIFSMEIGESLLLLRGRTTYCITILPPSSELLAERKIAAEKLAWSILELEVYVGDNLAFF